MSHPGFPAPQGYQYPLPHRGYTMHNPFPSHYAAQNPPAYSKPNLGPPVPYAARGPAHPPAYPLDARQAALNAERAKYWSARRRTSYSDDTGSREAGRREPDYKLPLLVNQEGVSYSDHQISGYWLTREDYGIHPESREDKKVHFAVQQLLEKTTENQNDRFTEEGWREWSADKNMPTYLRAACCQAASLQPYGARHLRDARELLHAAAAQGRVPAGVIMLMAQQTALESEFPSLRSNKPPTRRTKVEIRNTVKDRERLSKSAEERLEHFISELNSIARAAVDHKLAKLHVAEALAHYQTELQARKASTAKTIRDLNGKISRAKSRDLDRVLRYQRALSEANAELAVVREEWSVFSSCTLKFNRVVIEGGLEGGSGEVLRLGMD